MGIDNFLLTNRDIESRGIRFGGLLQRKRFAMTKKQKTLIIMSKCDTMKDILKTKKGEYSHVKTEC